MKRVACVLAPRDDGLILAVSRPDPPLRFGLPGGGIDPGETPLEAAARELYEETGLRPSAMEPLCQGNTGSAAVYWFVAGGLRGRLRSSHEGWAVWVEPELLVCRPAAAFPEPTAKVLSMVGIDVFCR